MSDINTTGVHSRTLTAFFDTRGAADQAISDLEAAGIPRQQIRRIDGGTSSTAAEAGSDTGFWASLKEMFMPDEDRSGYAEGLRRGGHMIAVTADEANYTRVTDILDRDGSINMDEREASWRKEGWTGYQAGGSAAPGMPASTTAAAQTRFAEDRTVSAAPIPSTSAGTAATAGAVAASTVAAGDEEVVPIYEEELRVGKRDVSHGRVRLRSYVAETPVSEQVGLREERVSVERRPVDRAVTGLSGDVFKDRVIEVEERAEEAVVSKDVRLKEEISLRKEANERTETVSNSVRHTEIDVQDDRDYTAVGAVAPAASASTSSFASMIAEHMDVIASDGGKIGTVDHMEGADRIKLTKMASPDGQHHFIPVSWVDHVDQHVHLNKAAEAVRAGW